MPWHVWAGALWFGPGGLALWAEAWPTRVPAYRMAGDLSLCSAGAMLVFGTLWPTIVPGLAAMWFAAALERRALAGARRPLAAGLPHLGADGQALDAHAPTGAAWATAEDVALLRNLRDDPGLARLARRSAPRAP